MLSGGSAHLNSVWASDRCSADRCVLQAAQHKDKRGQRQHFLGMAGDKKWGKFCPNPKSGEEQKERSQPRQLTPTATAPAVPVSCSSAAWVKFRPTATKNTVLC